MTAWKEKMIVTYHLFSQADCGVVSSLLTRVSLNVRACGYVLVLLPVSVVYKGLDISRDLGICFSQESHSILRSNGESVQIPRNLLLYILIFFVVV